MPIKDKIDTVLANRKLVKEDVIPEAPAPKKTLKKIKDYVIEEKEPITEGPEEDKLDANKDVVLEAIKKELPECVVSKVSDKIDRYDVSCDGDFVAHIMFGEFNKMIRVEVRGSKDSIISGWKMEDGKILKAETPLKQSVDRIIKFLKDQIKKDIVKEDVDESIDKNDILKAIKEKFPEYHLEKAESKFDKYELVKGNEGDVFAYIVFNADKGRIEISVGLDTLNIAIKPGVTKKVTDFIKDILGECAGDECENDIKEPEETEKMPPKEDIVSEAVLEKSKYDALSGVIKSLSKDEIVSAMDIIGGLVADLGFDVGPASGAFENGYRKIMTAKENLGK